MKKPAFSDLVLARWKMSIYLKKTERGFFYHIQSSFFFLQNFDLPYYGVNISIEMVGAFVLLWYKHKYSGQYCKRQELAPSSANHLFKLTHLVSTSKIRKI